jgi:uncharacterized protein YbjT (DUF2867 family)
MNTITQKALVLGATGKTGSRVARNLTELGIKVRTASRSGSDVRFDWDDTSTHAAALQDAALVYLVAPVLRLDFAQQVSAFLDLAERATVRHVTFLSAYGMERAPAEVAVRGVELDLIDRAHFSHSIVRPAWFMQNFSETFLQPVDGAIIVPTGDGTEAFVDAEDIAAVVAATLANPEAHAGAQYAPTGPHAITVAGAAEIISDVSDQPIVHHDIDRRAWIAGTVAAGVPADYAEMLGTLTDTIATGNGATPNTDVERVTGRAPTSFADYARRTAHAWTGEAVR